MDIYLLFFGKSQAFTIKGFSNEHSLDDFESIIPEFDLLESPWITVDKPDNSQILSWYDFQKSSKRYSLLKLFSHAQAKEGSRIEGSIYGVAFLSTANLLLDLENIRLLDALKTKFAELCLQGKKFKYVDFGQQAGALWQAFKMQNGFERIHTSSFTSSRITAPRILFIHMNKLAESGKYAEQLSSSADKIYFSEDCDHLIRYYKRHNSSVELMVDKSNRLVPYADIISVESQATKSPSDRGLLHANHHRSAYQQNTEMVLQRELNDLRKKGISDQKRFKKLLLFSVSSALVLFIIVVLLLLRGPRTEKIVVETPQERMVESTDFQITDYLMNELFLDTFKVNRMNEVLAGFIEVKTTKDTTKAKLLIRQVLQSASSISIDTTQLKQALKFESNQQK